MEKSRQILIATGIYPPKIGGPAQYAKNLKLEFERMGHRVIIKTFTIEDRIPTGVRHIFFFFKSIPAILRSDMVFALDTYGVGFPTVFGCKIFFKKCIIRTGGDFLWEQYCERHQKKVLLRTFYKTEKRSFDLKEKIIFWVTKWTLKNVTHTIFSTNWQREIFLPAYNLDKRRTSIVENYYGPKEASGEPTSKEFIASTRKLVWKNLDVLKNIFSKVGAELFLDNVPFEVLMEKMKHSYAVILISLGDISPNMILDAIRFNRPFICTKEVGIYDRIKEAGIFVDPNNEQEIENAVIEMLTEEGYRQAKERVRNLNFIHTWGEIAGRIYLHL